MSGLILYTTEDGAGRIKLRADGQTVWLTQAEMAELFDVTAENIRQHPKNIFSDKQLEPERTVGESLVVESGAGAGSQGYVRLPCIWSRLTPILLSVFNMGECHRHMHASLA